MELFKIIKSLKSQSRFLPPAKAGQPLVFSRLVTAARPFFAALLLGLDYLKLPGLILLPSSEEAENFYEDLFAFLPPELYPQVLLFPPAELSLFSKEPSPQRFRVLQQLISGEKVLIISSISALLTWLPEPETLKKEQLILVKGQEINLDSLSGKLLELGYRLTPMVEKSGDFSKRGGILDLFPFAGGISGKPFRLELWGDTIEIIKLLDIDSQRSEGDYPTAVIFPARELESREGEGGKSLLAYLPQDTFFLLYESRLLKEQAEAEQKAESFARLFLEISHRQKLGFFSDENELNARPLDLNTAPAPAFPFNFQDFIRAVKEFKKAGNFTLILSQQKERLKEILVSEQIFPAESQTAQPGNILLAAVPYSAGFSFPELSLQVLTDRELLGGFRRKRFYRDFIRPSLYRLEDLKPGEPVVHYQHGIGEFKGIKPLKVQGKTRDFITLEYLKGDLLYLPVEQMDLISKYIGVSEKKPPLSRLGGIRWNTAKQKVSESTKELAEKLLNLYRQRKTDSGFAFSSDTVWQQELEAGFPFEETPDQREAIAEVKNDMEKGKVMERLICGDAGYGKTEVALRAAFKAVMDGKQAAILVPTTILAQQHYNNFLQRIGTFPLRIEMLSRFKSEHEQQQIISDSALGKVDIVIGTHRLLQKDVQFKDLGLLIIDEEQRFGVSHKERLKELKTAIEVLTLTATPIPRTLYLSMIGAMDISRIDTPPADRLPVKTFLLPASPEVIPEAVSRELKRGGQVFFVHNRINGIERVRKELKLLLPQARIAVAHGKMPEEELQTIMLDFIDQKYDLLLSTTIIESGIDIPNVNTIIINNAHQFGLSQLYQLRGRVGRGHHQGYAFLLYPPRKILSSSAQERLKTLKEFSDLGSGFQIALKDLEIRGAGNLLGREQHGFIVNVGFNLYSEMLREAFSRAKGETPPPRTPSPRIDLPLKAFLPDDYVPYFKEKLTIYKKMAEFTEFAQVEELSRELRDKFGPLPEVVENLIKLLNLRILAIKANCPVIKLEGEALFFTLPDFKELSVSKLRKLEKETGLTFKFSPYQLTALKVTEEALAAAGKILKALLKG